VLGKNSPGYQSPVRSDKGKANYMFCFTDRVVEEGNEPGDAGAGTFYSALSNINLKIEDGNPFAVALRTVDNRGNVYVADGHNYIFDNRGKKTGRIEVPERPFSIQFGGRDRKTLFITARSSLYGVIVNDG